MDCSLRVFGPFLFLELSCSRLGQRPKYVDRQDEEGLQPWCGFELNIIWQASGLRVCSRAYWAWALRPLFSHMYIYDFQNNQTSCNTIFEAMELHFFFFFVVAKSRNFIKKRKQM